MVAEGVALNSSDRPSLKRTETLGRWAPQVQRQTEHVPLKPRDDLPSAVPGSWKRQGKIPPAKQAWWEQEPADTLLSDLAQNCEKNTFFSYF